MKYKTQNKILYLLLIILSIAVIASCGEGEENSDNSTGNTNPPAGDTTAPTVSSTNPANSATGFAVNSAITATFSESMDASTITTSTFTLSGGVTGTVTYSGTTATFTPSADLTASTVYTATITTGATDTAGNALAADYSWSFTTGATPDTTPPTVSSTNPANNTVNVAINSAVTATFSEALDPATVTTASFTLTDSSSNSIAGTVGYAGTTATFTPSASLAYSTSYTATLTTAIRDTAGNAMNANYNWSFTTGAAPDTIPPTVISTNPANNATSVATNATVSVTFSEAMNCNTLTTATFTLSSGSAVTGNVSCNGSTAIFTPLSNLTANTSYTATVTTGVRDLAGNALAADYTWSFSTSSQKTWSAPTLIQTGSGNAQSPHVAFDSSGNAIAVWSQWNGVDAYDLYANRYTSGVGWGTPVSIENSLGSSFAQQIAINASGDAIVVWNQGPYPYKVYANRYTVSGGWGTAAPIESLVGNTEIPQVAIDADGNAIAVWLVYDGAIGSIYVNRYTAGSGWGTAAPIESGTLQASAPHVAIDTSGNAIAIWSQNTGTRSAIFANRYTAGSGWGTAAVIENGSSGAGSPRIAFDGSGNAVAVWLHWDNKSTSGVYTNVYANRYIAGSGWGTPELIKSSDDNNASTPQVAVDADDNAIAVWQQGDVYGYYSIYANRFTVSGGWGTPTTIESASSNAWMPQISMDGSGNAMAVWHQNGTPLGVYANHFSVGSWNAPATLTSGAAVYPQIAMDFNGNAIAVWLQSDGTGNYLVYACRYE